MGLGHQIGKDLCEALKLPKQTKSFVLRVESNQIVTVECEYYPEDGSFIPVLAEFDLVRREPVARVEDAPPIHFDTWMRFRTHMAHAEYQHRMSMLAADDAIQAEKQRVADLKEVVATLEGIL